MLIVCGDGTESSGEKVTRNCLFLDFQRSGRGGVRRD